MKIGLEVHLQLPTRSKLFCSCPTTAEQPNTAVCPTCLGFPGSRPVMNRRALQLGLMITKFLDCKVNEKVWFSRKTYFYPDLPKDFQITQYESPLGTDGHFTLNDHRIGIWRVHLEEDPGRIKRVGRSGEEVSFIDYNRSGIPLVEIVSAPDLRSPDEAREYIDMLVTELRHLVGLSVQDEQTVRVDANISVGEERVEVKNVQGLRNLERALRYEANRQTKVLEAGKKVVRETRRYDEERKVTLPAREKEFEEDYGYIGEPDLGEFTIGPMARELVIPETPYRRAERLAQSIWHRASDGATDGEHLLVHGRPFRVPVRVCPGGEGVDLVARPDLSILVEVRGLGKGRSHRRYRRGDQGRRRWHDHRQRGPFEIAPFDRGGRA